MLILKERSKLPLKLADSLPPCNCTIRQSIGIPCFHTIRQRQNSPGVLLITDVDPHWYYDRTVPLPMSNTESKRFLLEPLNIKGKGRPRGVLGRCKKLHRRGEGESSTRREPSLFEHKAVCLPSRTGPIYPENMNPPLKRQRLMTKAMAEAQASIVSPSSAPRDQIQLSVSTYSTSALGLMRGAGTDKDLYDPGTERQRAFMRSINPEKLANSCPLEEHDGENSSDEENT